MLYDKSKCSLIRFVQCIFSPNNLGDTALHYMKNLSVWNHVVMKLDCNMLENQLFIYI